ncbi:GNAT family N-acetyltransferase [Rhodoferax sp.]|jgi:ribosomal-protein-alanine N-acetyltransferase|uniref:GNAT family N-acetyltransferase n=1 Tax=Rhodoferax sp. TaxID=50421 RepID=UPI003783D913
MRIPTTLGSAVLRLWNAKDKRELVIQGNDRAVWRNLLSGFPHPYTEDDAASWVDFASNCYPSIHLCIEVNGAVADGIGIIAGTGTEQKTGQLGYWLGRAYWGQGVATAAAQAMVAHADRSLPVVRLQAPVLAWNPASMRVLEKAGFYRESVLRKSVFKDGELIDSVMYVRVRDDT